MKSLFTLDSVHGGPIVQYTCIAYLVLCKSSLLERLSKNFQPPTYQPTTHPPPITSTPNYSMVCELSRCKWSPATTGPSGPFTANCVAVDGPPGPTMVAMEGLLCRKWSPGENQLMVEINRGWQHLLITTPCMGVCCNS